MLGSPQILQMLEDESIEILREAAAAFRKPVLLYSIGKDSSVLLHLARKAFYPGPIPFPMLHVDTTWKFREMISFRDQIVKEYGLNLLVHTNQAGVDEKVNPFTSGISEYTRVMKTVALRQALDEHGFDVAIGGSRRDEERSRAKRGFLVSVNRAIVGIQGNNVLSYGVLTIRALLQARACEFSRSRIGPN